MDRMDRTRIGWVDWLRVAACFLVVVSHCCDPFIAQFGSDRSGFLTGVWLGSLVRPCVPLFVMMTGVLLLPLRQEMEPFYRKRIGRIVWPLVFWSLALPLLFFGYLHGVAPETTNPLIAGSDHTSGALWNKLYTFVFNFNFDTVPMWYLYMLIGLYLLMPVLNGWMRQASRKELKLFLTIWVVSLLMPYVQMVAPLLGFQGYFGNGGILGVCDWNAYGTFYYFSGFVGYLVLAYYLTTYPPAWSWRKMWLVSVPMFATGYLVTAGGFLLMQRWFPGDYAKLEIVWLFAGINVFLMTFPVFAIVQKWNPKGSAWLSKLASWMFGAYLCHYVFVTVFYDVFDGSWPYWLRIAAMATAVFAVSSSVAGAMMHFRLTRRFVQ